MPSGLNATLITASVWPVSGGPIGWPVSASHTRTVLSTPPETMRVAVGAERHTEHRSVWPVSGCADGLAGVGVPHPHVLSPLPETMRLPSGLNATLFTASVWPVSGCADRAGRWPRPTPAPSCPHCRRRCAWPSGLNATLSTQSCGRSAAAPIGLAGVGVPQPHRLVLAAGGDALAVGAERHAPHQSVWPVSGSPMGWPVAASHTAPCCRRRRRRCACRRG